MNSIPFQEKCHGKILWKFEENSRKWQKMAGKCENNLQRKFAGKFEENWKLKKSQGNYKKICRKCKENARKV